MKHFQYLVAIVLVLMVAITPGFASKGTSINKGTIPSVDQTNPEGQRATGKISDPEVRHRAASAKSVTRMSPSALAKTSSPVPKVDGSSAITAGMSGTYHIPGDFASITIAVAVVNFAGVSGATTWQLDSPSYTEASGGLVFGNFPTTATLTIQPKAGQATTINFTPSAGEGKGFAFNNAHDITIDGLNTGGASLTLQYAGGTFPASDPFAATIYVTGGSSDITVQNTNIKGQIVTAGAFDAQTEGRPAAFVYRATADGASNSNIAIDNNTVTNATFGFKCLTEGDFENGPNVSFSHNNVGSAYGAGVSIAALWDWTEQAHYDYNVIDGVEFAEYYWNNGPTEYDLVGGTFAPPNDFMFDFGQPTGGHMYQCLNSTMNYNWVKSSVQNYTDGFAFIIYGLLNRIGGAGTVIANNRIEGVHTTDVDGTDAGMRTESNAYHNSVRFTGVQGAGQVSYTARPVAGNFYNNALSNERTGAAGANIRCLQGTPGGGSNGNAFYSSTGRISTGATLASYFGTGKDANSQYGPINFDASMHITAGPSSAENIGISHVFTGNDVDGDTRDTTNAGTRDAGADEFANTGSPTAADVFPDLINPPNAAGEPFGLPTSPKVTVKNNSTTATGSFNLNVTTSDGYNNNLAISLGSLESKIFTMPAWSPASAGTYTITATTSLGGDAVPGNDAFSRSQTFTTPATIIGDTVVFNSTTAEGWVGAGDFVLSNAFAKPHITGPYSGYSFVTKTTGGYTNAAIHTVTSPFYNLASLGGDGNVYVSFRLALATEPSWDRAWMQYTLDGTTWSNLGSLNDPNGVNWYSTGVYANAAGNNTVDLDCWDDVTALGLGIVANATDVPAGWTSNGDCSPTGADLHTGPDGYIYQQLKITPAAYPTVVGAPIIKFRFIAFGDAGSDDDGWAIDDMRIGGTAPVLNSATVSGNVYGDTDGSGGKNGGESGTAGVRIDLKYFGVHVAYDTTDVNGDYSLTMNAPGAYTVNSITVLGVSQPLGNLYSVNYTGNGVNVTGKDFGLYDGMISGHKYDDINDNGTDNSEPGLNGWTIQVHTDSCNGAVIASGVTAGGGLYGIAVPPGSYYVTEVPQAGWRNTTPLCSGPVVVAGTSGSGTAHVAGPNFGNFHKSTAKLFLGTDQNGNGVYDGGADNFALPFGVKEYFDRKHNGVHVAYDTLGNGLDFIQLNDVDTGTLSWTILGTAPATWVRTLDFGGTYSVNIATSGQNPVAHFLDYQPITVSGYKFDDKNGDGIFNGADTKLSGWKINLSGVGGGSATTDSAGNYSFSGVGGGAHVLSEVVQSGWQATSPVSGSYALNVTSKNLGGDMVRNFGNFKQISISGQKYRDRNGNGNKDAGDNGLSGWTINATNGGGSQLTDVNGDYTFANLGPGTYVISEVSQAGYVQTAPVGGTHTIIAVSGVNATGKDFGNYQQGDSATYRTWTYAELRGATEAKPVKRPKAGKPIIAPPNSANLLTELYTQPKVTMGPVIQVGLSAQLVSGKEKGYLLPGKQSEVYATLNTKSTVHTGAPKPLSFYNDGIKRLMKRLKTLPASKANNVLVANLLTFKVNLAASAKGQTDPGLGLGNLIYCEAGHAGLSGKSLSDISSYSDSLMTNWDDRGIPGTPSAMWVDLNAVIEQINAAFSTGSTTDTAVTGGWTAPKLKWAVSTITAQSTSFLCAPGAGMESSSNHDVVTDGFETPMPTVYALGQNYPNPFNPTTMLNFDLPTSSLVTLKVYNMLGQEVATLINNEEIESGQQEVEFDASTLVSGVYFYRITAQAIDDDGMTTGNTFTKTMKMMLVK